ncbi:MAG: trigger factor, partial [Chloroflexi bacterium]|nr:trigger factor [Chloroflexota bacterium]
SHPSPAIIPGAQISGASPRYTSARIPQWKIEQQPLDTCEVRLSVEVDPAEAEQAKRAAARRLAQKYKIPGFRLGKAPYEIIARHLGESAVWEEAMEPLGQKVYKAALTEAGLHAFAPGQLVDVKLDPVTFTFNVPLPPEVALGDYRSARLGYDDPEITEEALDAALEHLREHQAVLEPVERAAQLGDVITMDIAGAAEPAADPSAEAPADSAGPVEPAPAAEDVATPPGDEFLLDDKDIEVLLDPELEWPVPGFVETVAGIAVGEERHIELRFPDDYGNETLRGRLGKFDVKCTSVKSRSVPEWDDELAKSLGEYESLADMREKVRAELFASAQHEKTEEYNRSVVDVVVAGASVRFPPALLQEEVDDLVQDLDRRLHEQKLTVNDYLKIQKLTLEKLRADLEAPARERLRRSLVLSKVIAVEGVEVTDSDITERIERIVSPFGDNSDRFRELFQTEVARRSTRLDLLTEKAIARLASIARGENPPLPEPAAEEAEPAEGVAAPAAEVILVEEVPPVEYAVEPVATEAAAEESSVEPVADDKPAEAAAEVDSSAAAPQAS